jgi:hypothetical protein
MVMILLFAGRAEGVSIEIQVIDFLTDGIRQKSTYIARRPLALNVTCCGASKRRLSGELRK